ncbi:hypothetical protein C8N35_101350 [Breoghania corrubedonensis]|uniref:Copper(I)-binding protein n=1 Tax=Breoghania corrubedonensis TaxID=665038 RepID=A0A2T5VEZ0_9HYPH|nr:hypothetical protein [Breoghania corrubedonensis]PTW62310.1 hypothetical protein C8N35_101350 [Breoghania corrubedonensis]
MSIATAIGRTAKATAVLGTLLAGAAMLVGAATMPGHAEEPAPAAKLVAAQEALDQAWSEAPLGFTVAIFTSGKAGGYGRYTPRENAVFAPGEAINVYAEPVAYGFAREDDLVAIALAASFELRTPGGQILASGDDFAHLTAKARHPIREFPATLTYRFDGLSPGDYVLVTKLADDNSDKSGAFSLPFTVKAR